MAVYLATRREVNTQAPQLSHGREAALKKGKRKPEKPSSPPHRRILGHACPGKRLFPGHVPLGHVRHALTRAASVPETDCQYKQVGVVASTIVTEPFPPLID